jgi:hypothetical protein
MRSVPNFGATQYSVNGYVYKDVNMDNVKSAGEPGLSGVQVRMDPYSTFTDGSGYFNFRVFAGNYVLKHTPPTGYGTFTSPDSFVLAVASGLTRSFADTMRQGGTVHVHVYQDLNTNGSLDAGEPNVPSITATINPGGGATGPTDAMGAVDLFSQVGSYTLALTLPDSFLVSTTPYPITSTMINGGTASYDIGLRKSLSGKIAGKVYQDNNRDGVWQSGEAGIQNAWVGVTNDGGTTIQGYAYTDASGNYSITVPINDPPHSTPYSVFCIPSAGRYPTGSTSIGGLWVQNLATLSNNNFGMASFQIITLNASRVLSLASKDLIENDWNGNQTQNAHGDRDLVLGADAGGTDNISVWFNQYPTNGNQNLFSASPDYTRNAPQSVMAIAVDTLDSDATWKLRPDVVTGTKTNVSGNFFVWLTQNTSGNYGYMPTTYSPGLNYRTSDNGDVQSVLTMDCAGGAMPDIIVGTKSPTANYGTIEVWQNNDAVSPTFSRQETYPNAGSIPGNNLGEVNAMILADLDNDGRKDLIVGTKTGPSSGEIVVFANVSKNNGSRFICRAKYSLVGDIVTSLATIDLNGDGKLDIIAGTQSGTASGNLKVFQSVVVTGSSWSFANVRNVAANGIVMSLTAGDFGGSTMDDLVVGWRSNTTSFVGGVYIYFTSVLTGLPPAGVDPSSGAVANMVPATCRGNFDFGTNPLPAAPYLTDLAAGVKVSATTGALVVFIR